MALAKCTDEQILEALQKHNGLRAPAAVELGLVYRALIERIARMRGKGIEIPDSSYHAEVRGTSTLTGPRGEVKLTWTKTAVGEPSFAELTQIVRDVLIDTRAAPRVAVPRSTGSKDLLVAIPIGDQHHGMHAYGPEAGADWDVKISENLLMAAAEHLIDISPPCETCLIADLGDLLHYDSHRAETPANRNALDADTRYTVMIRGGVRMFVTFIDSALRKFKRVIADVEPGNHNPIGALWLALVLEHHYRENPRVTIRQPIAKYSYLQHGKVLIGITHGDTAKLDKLGGIMATDEPEMWGNTLHRYWLTGHIHQRKVIELAGCTVESFRTLAARDAWATAAGYRSGRDLTSIVYHKEHGEVARHRFNPTMLEAA